MHEISGMFFVFCQASRYRTQERGTPSRRRLRCSSVVSIDHRWLFVPSGWRCPAEFEFIWCPGMKNDGAYYRDAFPIRQRSSVVHKISGEFFVFRQCSAVCARDSQCPGTTDVRVHFTRSVVHPNSPNLNTVDYRIRECSSGITTRKLMTSTTEAGSDWWHGLSQSVVDDAIGECCTC